MKELAALCESLKLRAVKTYIQSGNVVFLASEKGMDTLAHRIEDAIEKSYGFRVGAVLRTVHDMRNVLDRNPFASRAETEPNKLLVLFLAAEPLATDLRASKAEGEDWKLLGRELYIYYPNGMGQSKLTFPSLKVTSTGRNWNTVRKLAEMAASLGT